MQDQKKKGSPFAIAAPDLSRGNVNLYEEIQTISKD